MDITFLDVFDLIRVMGGMIAANLLFTVGNAKKRSHFWIRSIFGCLACLIIAQAYSFLQMAFLKIESFGLVGIIMGIWWFSLTALALAYTYFCYEITIGDMVFRGVLAGT